MSKQYENAGAVRRLAAGLYDGFLIVALWIFTTLIAVILTDRPVGGLWFQLMLYGEVFLFYFVFWRIQGQTLGMQVWKIRTLDLDGNIMGPNQCIIRFLAGTLSLAALGLGFLWMFFNKDRLAWHDIVSDSRVIFLGPQPYRSD